MQIYTVHEPMRAAEGLEERADGLVFVREGFSLAAFLFGPFWLAAHRLWLPLAAYAGAFLLLQGLFAILPGGAGAIGAVMALASLGFALEANTLWRWGLERRGYRLAGTAVGKNFEECEHRFLTGWLAELNTPARATAAPSAAPTPVSLATPI